MDEAVRAAVLQYFQGEKLAGIACLPVGAILAAIAIALFVRGGPRAAAWPLAIGALILLGLGVVLAVRSDGQASTLITRLDAAALATETARIRRVVGTFTMLKVLWCTLIAGGVAATYLFDKPWVRPLAIGIIVVAALLLIFDLVADVRARTYLTALAGAAIG